MRDLSQFLVATRPRLFVAVILRVAFLFETPAQTRVDVDRHLASSGLYRQVDAEAVDAESLEQEFLGDSAVDKQGVIMAQARQFLSLWMFSKAFRWQ